MLIKKFAGVFGGTFDPVSLGHVHVVNQLLKDFPFDEIQVIPLGIAPHNKQPEANPAERLAMLKLAFSDAKQVLINDIEIKNPGISYTLDTIVKLKKTEPNTSFAFIMGIDVFEHFDTWHHWQEILNYCHLFIVNRPGYDCNLNKTLEKFFNQHRAHDTPQLMTTDHGCILIETIAPCSISATNIRQALHQKAQTDELLPEAVRQYIEQNHLY